MTYNVLGYCVRKSAVFNMIVFGLFFTFFPMAFDYAFQYYSPASFWFSYTSVEPESVENTAGEPIPFISTADHRRALNMVWSDTLVCSHGTSPFREVSVLNWKAKNYSSQEPTQRWDYTERVPSVSSVCYLDVQACGKTPRGFEKCQSLRSGTFYLYE